MELMDRIKYLMKINNMSSSVFADEIDVQRSSVSHVLSGRNNPSLEFVQKILKRFPKVDASWLVSGTPSQIQQINTEEDERSIGLFERKEKEVAKDEDPAYYNYNNSLNTGKKIVVKVITLYNDHTFDEYTPSVKE